MRKIDRPFLITVIILVVAGFFIFTSASLGLLARDGARFSSVAFNQFFLGIFLGLLAMLAMTRIKYTFWRKYAFYIFLVSIFTTLLVFIPGLAIEFGGARRWINFGIITFQPAEMLKIGFVIFFAAWLTNVKDKIHTYGHGIIPFIILLGITGGILLSQPDTGTFIVILASGLAMFIVAGARWRDIFFLGIISATGVAILANFQPYIKTRILTFINPASDTLGAGWQIKQSLIAIGSGEWFGRGFGQSVQKFQYLPEPIGDSIFAVAAEEFGFIGSILLITLFLFLAFRGLKIAAKAPDSFGRLFTVGIVILIISQSFMNIGSMLGVMPLTGLPLLFVSHGGSALLFALAEIGIILNISKFRKT
ncbi:stage V sporulation protein E [Candidatus Campbellbacteria bacterium CG10_big_fil_rev_8_21_14_0_10_35_52]|uniref:Probable peptidoglycan glycosyltransferase FtsW n=1 Tax=Candidatus Campbellbacteria bacterium CG10_big_fil_rev_8_21_14_0_10_35_52 TaxID=1974527 RepID=A0A2M6WV91_9BACT|nr:MAG: stage V sporulation protein E [Candidatus Campbellbacteria bacterium CG10_big_fil_rev_8_21_14_0_10_35_52]